MNKPTIDPHYVERMDNEEYHSMHEFLSNSMLSHWRKGRRHFESRFVTGEVKQSPPSKAMTEGTLKHLAFLERDAWEEMVIQIPGKYLAGAKVDGARTGKPYHFFVKEHPGKTCLKKKEVEHSRKLVAAIDAAHGHLIWKPGMSEVSLFWSNPETGVPCRCRIDRLVTFDPGNAARRSFIFDMKNLATSLEQDFYWSARKFGYAEQAAHYQEGVRVVLGGACRFDFLAVGKEEPFAPRLYHLDPATVEAANDRRVQHLAEIAECRQSGDYSDPYEHDSKKVFIHPKHFRNFGESNDD